MDELKEIILTLLKEIESKDTILNVTGRGYGAGRIRKKNPFPVSYGLGNEENKESKKIEIKPVKVSKAFKRKTK